jgi:hypothetical protein
VSSYPTAFGEDLFVLHPGSSARIYVAEGYRGVSVLDATDLADLRRVSSCPGIYAVGVSGWNGPESRELAYAVDTARVWQIDILVPRWIAPAAPGSSGTP